MTKKVVAVTENWQISHVIVNDSMAFAPQNISDTASANLESLYEE